MLESGGCGERDHGVRQRHSTFEESLHHLLLTSQLDEGPLAASGPKQGHLVGSDTTITEQLRAVGGERDLPTP
ncbi:MAG: hypothetical protein MUE73_03150 [Planctomycetes bacterium]|nr:hypothetical protein [Planctomycetota bacterium]